MPSPAAALVTGATEGIGRATALALGRAGYRVGVCARTPARLEVLVGELRAEGITAAAAAADVGDAAQVTAAVERITGELGDLDVLVNNAGIEILGDVLETEPETWDEVHAVNLRGTYLASRAFLPGLLRQAERTGMAAIVNNASLMGLVSSRRLAAYCAAKAGVVSLTRSMALDHAEQGVRVNCVCPGIIHTPMLERRFALQPDRVQAYRTTAQRPPVKYLGRPEDVAAAIAYLASDEARFMTGSALTIDGGVGAE
jgi:NAD(P)-dependent dehydrogenase (short-subunit alcohol dehydrogenase family)